MPDDLRKQIIEAIAASSDENFKRMMMLLLRVEEIFIERVDSLAEQMTVPALQHTEDHKWISSNRTAEGNVKAAIWKVVISFAEKSALIAAGIIAGKLLGTG